MQGVAQEGNGTAGHHDDGLDARGDEQDDQRDRHGPDAVPTAFESLVERVLGVVRVRGDETTEDAEETAVVMIVVVILVIMIVMIVSACDLGGGREPRIGPLQPSAEFAGICAFCTLQLARIYRLTASQSASDESTDQRPKLVVVRRRGVDHRGDGPSQRSVGRSAGEERRFGP